MTRRDLALLSMSLCTVSLIACGGDGSAQPLAHEGPDAGEHGDAATTDRGDASTPPSTGTTAAECFAGIAPAPDEREPYMEIARFVTQGGKYQIVRAREKRGRWIGGNTVNHQLARVWIDGGDEQGTCITSPAAMTYSVSHHNFDDQYTVATAHATYAFDESLDFTSAIATWHKTLELRDGAGSVTEGPLTLLDVCSAVLTLDPQDSAIQCLPVEPAIDPEARQDDWQGCPAAEDFPPATGDNLLAVSTGAEYCAAFVPDQTLAEAFATRAMLRFTPGDYALPTGPAADYRLPACARVHGVSTPITTRPAQLTHAVQVVDWQDVHRYSLDAPVEGLPGATLHAELELAVDNGSPPWASLNGEPDLPLHLGGSSTSKAAFRLCADGPSCERSTRFDSCLTAWDGAGFQHLITFEGGDLLSFRIDHSSVPTERVSFASAWGRWRGRDFQQRDRFKLVYAAPLDHGTRSVAVLFDEPIDGACGLRVSDIDPLDPATGTAATIDCELQDIESIAIVSTELPSL